MIHLIFAFLLLQPLPEPPVTTFAQHCYAVDGDAVTVYFGYTSNTERHYIGSGYDFVTGVGEYPDAFAVDVGSYPAPELPYIALAEVVSTGDPALDIINGGMGEMVVVAFSWDTLFECGQPPIEPPNPLPTPTPEPCEAVAINAGTGLLYCYTPGASGVIPLPPAP